MLVRKQKNKNSFIAGGNYSHFGRQPGSFLNIHLPCAVAVVLLVS